MKLNKLNITTTTNWIIVTFFNTVNINKSIFFQIRYDCITTLSNVCDEYEIDAGLIRNQQLN